MVQEKSTAWIIGFLSTLLVSMLGLWVESLSSEMKAFQSGVTERTAKIAALEISQSYTNQTLEKIDKKIDIVVTKLDAHMSNGK